MKTGFYPKLAWDGIRKNRRMYFPYILTGGVMVMMYYIMSFLTESPALQQMPGGSVLMTVLPLGCGIIAIFSLLFLFYTNSFLIKQRYREFGLYNILGMDKKNVGRLMIWETLFTWILAMVMGLAAGIAFSKAAELILLNLLGLEVSFSLSIGTHALSQTVLIYAGIYVILLFNSVIRVVRSRPLELMQSSRVGEQKLKCNWLFAAAGVILLGAAYFLAVRIEEPTEAFFLFFVAVIMVILGTYLLFISGSVAFCKLLQSNKNYYYKPNHFVSVSSMAYRMKRNGAGLASICILLTMVLVMLSSTTTLYFGEESAVRNRYPQGIEVKIWYDDIKGISDENLDMLRKEIEACTGPDVDLRGIRTCSITGALVEDGIILVDYTDADSASYSNMGYLYAISTDDYNYMMHTDAVLADDECLLYSDRMNTQWDSFTVQFGQTYKVKEQLTEFCADQDALISIASTVYMVVNDLSSLAAPLSDITNPNGYPPAEYFWRCGFDEETPEKEKEVRNQVYEVVKAHTEKADSTANYFHVHSREVQRAAFFEMYGSLFFLGIMLSIVFLLAAVLIIYYKQISEGYEDQNRFEIMQKVGMTKQDIRKSINSQMLTVFFLPLVMAGIHLAFAYPFISKILLLFAFDNTVLNVTVTLTCFAIFGLFYTIVYKITSGSYYAIVSGGRER